MVIKKIGLTIYQGRDWRLPNGKKLKPHRKKRKYEMGRYPTHTKLGKEKIIPIRTKGGGTKVRVYFTEYANIYDPKQGKIFKVKILKVVENKSDRNLDRMKIITKGAIIETELGLAKVTSRPGQDGILNAILIS